MTNPSLGDIPHFLHLRNEPGKRMAWVMALVVHALLAIFLIYGVRWQTSAPEAVSVDLVRYMPPAAADKPAPPAPEKKPPEPVPQTVPKEEPPAPPKADILRKAPEKEKPTIKEKATQSIDVITRLLQRETERMTNSRIADALNREQAQLKASQAASATSSAKATWASRISAKIKGNIVRPPNIAGNPEAIFEITLLPDGSLVGEPKLKKSTGNQTLDDAIVRAILKSSPLPKPDDQSVFERVLSLTFRPMED